jgi:splicing factor U2AF 65 kDa subunit
VNRGDLFTPSRQAKRLYIGNLPPNISPFDLLNFMNAQFIASGIFAANPGPPVVDTSVANDGAYAFIELRTPQEATMSMAFDGLVFQGQALRVRRPKDYVPMPEDSLVPNVQVDGLDIVSTNVEDSPDKVFIGGLPAHLNEQDVKELLSLFGKLKAFNLVRDSHTSMSKGYAFCVFAEAEKTDTACQSLNGMKIGDKTLVVQRASTNPRTLDVETEATGLNPMQKFTSSILNLSTPLPTIFAHLQASNVLPPAPEASTVVVLLNMVDVTDDFEEDYYKRIASDARVEAETYGAVANLVIPRPPPKNKEENVRRLIMPGTAEAEALKMEQLQKASTEVTIEEVLAQAARTRAEMQTEEGARKRQQESEAALANEEKEAQEMAKRMLPSAAGLGKIFIHFESKDAAVSAQRDFAGRKYDGRMVMTSFYPEDKFLAAEF